MKWKQFEELVALVERLLTNAQATVVADDHIEDRYGNIRQVDVSVRIKTGTSELLIILECRDRKKVEDVTWVEQANTKRDNLRADRLILVTNKPMSANAQAMAKDKGLEIRSLREIEKSFLPSIFPDRMQFKSVGWHSEGVAVYPANEPYHESWYLELQDAMKHDNPPVRLEFPDGQTFTLAEVCQQTIAALGTPELAPGVERHVQEVEALPRTLTAKVKFGKHVVEIVRLTVIAVATVTTVKPTHSFAADYTSDSKLIDHLIEQTGIDREGTPIKFSMIGKRDDNKFQINVPYSFLEANVREGIDPERGVTLEITLDDTRTPTMRRVQ